MSAIHPSTNREWQRFTPAERLARYVVYLTVVIAVVVSAHAIEIIPEFLLDAPEQFADMFQRMWPVAWGYYPEGVHEPLVETLSIAALATVMGLVMGIPVGFLGKLFTEAIEEISLKQIEAVRATGASFMNTIVYGVIPQVMFRFIGFAAYETDANLRNSTMVGIVGAGGIGGTLFAAFQRFDYDFVFAILIAIIALIMIGEVLQIQVKRVFKQ